MSRDEFNTVVLRAPLFFPILFLAPEEHPLRECRKERTDSQEHLPEVH